MTMKNIGIHKRAGIRASKLDDSRCETLGAPIAALANRIVAAADFVNSTLTIAAQPDCPRNLTGTLTDANSSVTAGIATVTYVDIEGVQRTEVLTFTQLKAGWTGTRIVARVVSIIITAAVGGAPGTDTVVFGVGNVIGLPNPIESSSQVRHVYLDGTRIASPTIVTGALKSGVDVSGSTYNGTKLLRVWYTPGLASSTR